MSAQISAMSTRESSPAQASCRNSVPLENDENGRLPDLYVGDKSATPQHATQHRGPNSYGA